MNPAHYPDLDRCKKLTELGFPEGEKHWVNTMSEPKIYPSEIHTKGGNPYVCPSVMEMWDLIPEEIEDWTFASDWKGVGFQNCNGYFEVDFGGTLPNALADMVVWLAENGHLTFDK